MSWVSGWCPAATKRLLEKPRPPHVGVHSHCSRSSQKFVMEAEAPFEGEDYVVRELDVYLAGASSEDKKPAYPDATGGWCAARGWQLRPRRPHPERRHRVRPPQTNTTLPPLPHRLFTYRSPRS